VRLVCLPMQKKHIAKETQNRGMKKHCHQKEKSGGIIYRDAQSKAKDEDADNKCRPKEY
jgi:hypothetical protein